MKSASRMHVSFDFDYTLADSSEGTVVCATYALEEMGMPACAPSVIRKTVGLSLERTFEALTGGASTSPEAARFKRLFLFRSEQVMLDHIHIYDGARLTLDALKGEGHYISIVSTKLKERIEAALSRDGLDELVDDIVGGGCVERNKPDPEGLVLAMTRSGVLRERTVYVGDSVTDGECAQRANVSFIGLLSGQTAASELKKWNPLQLFDEVGQMAAGPLPFLEPHQ